MALKTSMPTMLNTTNTPLVSHYPVSVPVNDEQMSIILIILGCCITGLLSMFGTACNIINITVFLKLGFKDTTNISLLCIAVADTGALITLLWGAICLNPLMVQRFDDLEMSEINYVTSVWPHSYFVRVTGFLTCVVTIERYICIAYPLKVRSIVTPRRTIIVNVSMFVVMSAGIIPLFASTYAVVRVSVSKNRTVVGLITREALAIESYVRYTNNVFRPVTFFTVLLMTMLLIYKLNSNTKWRNSTASSNNKGSISIRDQKVVVMVLFISIFFIFCYFPIFVNFFGSVFEKEFTVTGKYKNLFTTIGLFLFLLEAINSTAHIFIYLRMSSKYRDVFMSFIGLTSSNS